MASKQLKLIRLKPAQLFLLLAAVVVTSAYLSVTHIGHAKATASPFQEAFVRLDNLDATSATSGRVCVKPSVVNAGSTIASIKVTFPTTSGTDYIVNSTAANWTVTTTNLDTGQIAMPTIATANNVTGKAVTFPLGTPQTLSSSNLYCFNFSGTSTLTTSSAGAAETTQGTIASQIAGPTIEDQTTYSESIITNDQVVVNATVPPSFSFVLNGNTDGFASNLSTGSVNTSNGGRTITIVTNAASGWIVWAEDLNSSSGKGALQSATAGNYKIAGTASPGTASAVFTAGAENYGLATTINTDAAGGGTVALDAAYNGTTSNFAGTLDPTRFRPIATSNGTANGDIINMKELVTIAGQTPAASDYTDTITFVGAGQF